MQHLSEQADLHLISNNMKIDYYVQVKERFAMVLAPETVGPPREKPGGPVLQAGSVDAHRAMKRVSSKLRHYMGFKDHGRR